jgi:hypothetical protein
MAYDFKKLLVVSDDEKMDIMARDMRASLMELIQTPRGIRVSGEWAKGIRSGPLNIYLTGKIIKKVIKPKDSA